MRRQKSALDDPPMPRTKPTTVLSKCIGGYSMFCRTDEHPFGKIRNIYCLNCKARMGCSLCCEPPQDLACSRCRQWATRKALEFHGPMVPVDKVLIEVQRIIGAIDLPF